LFMLWKTLLTVVILTHLASLTFSAPLVVSSSAFAGELACRTVTASTFVGVPLALHSPVSRAKVLTDFARRCDAYRHPDAALKDAVAGQDLNGRRRGQHMASYDWLRDGKRVACKSAQLAWKARDNLWALHFRGVKLDAYDELLLAAYTPTGVHLFRHDGRAGLSTNGKATEATGKNIVFLGPRHELDWCISLAAILDKLNARATPLASAGFH